MSYSKGALLPPAPSTVRGSSVKLGLDPKGDRVVYCNSRSVFLLSLSGSSPNIAYSQHAKDTTVAKVSPTGYYVASADVSGTVRIWDIAGDEQILKNEVKALGGRINDLEWDGEGKRVVVAGDGRDRFAAAFTFDTGSSVGELSGHSKVVNAVSVRKQRPFRAVTGGDDRTLIFSHGVPFKYAKTLNEHTGFVQDVAFSPSGDHFASVGADGKLLLYDGSSGDFVSALPSEHKGTIFALSWSADSKSISTSGADKTVRIWDVEKQAVTQSWTVGDGVEHQQVGNAWSGGPNQEIVSLSFGGNLNVFDKRTGDIPAKVLYGHQKSVTSLSNKLPSAATFYTGSYDGRVHAYDLSTERGECKPLAGAGHTNGVVGIAASDRGSVYTAGMDDTVREIESDAQAFSSSTVPIGSQPTSIAVDGQGTQFVATGSEVQVIQGGKRSSSVTVPANATSVAVSTQGLLAVGAADGKTYLFSASSLKAHSVPALDKNSGTVTAVAFSPDGSLLAAGDSGGKIIVYNMPSGELKTASWVFHTAKVASIAWAPSGTRAVSTSLDTNVYVWNTVKPNKNIAIKNAHAGGATGAQFVDEDTVVSTGADAAVKTWKIKHHAV